MVQKELVQQEQLVGWEQLLQQEGLVLWRALKVQAVQWVA
jgi:hypothetical protein